MPLESQPTTEDDISSHVQPSQPQPTKCLPPSSLLPTRPLSSPTMALRSPYVFTSRWTTRRIRFAVTTFTRPKLDEGTLESAQDTRIGKAHCGMAVCHKGMAPQIAAKFLYLNHFSNPHLDEFLVSLALNSTGDIVPATTHQDIQSFTNNIPYRPTSSRP